MKLVFEWDRNKENSNLRKHKVSFKEAETIFQDDLTVTFFDDFHSGEEDRFISIGTSANSRILLVVHTEIEEIGDVFRIRIISSRKATASERKIYEKGR